MKNLKMRTSSSEVSQPLFPFIFKAFFSPRSHTLSYILHLPPSSPLWPWANGHRYCSRETRANNLYRSGRRYQASLNFWMLLGTVPGDYYFPLINLRNEAVRQEVFPPESLNTVKILEVLIWWAIPFYSGGIKEWVLSVFVEAAFFKKWTFLV